MMLECSPMSIRASKQAVYQGLEYAGVQAASAGSYDAVKAMVKSKDFIEGPLAFGLTGVVSGLTTPLAETGIGVFVVSTFDTDYLLVKAVDYVKAFGLLAERFEFVR